MKKQLVILLLLMNNILVAQTIFRTQIFNPTLKTLQIGLKNEKFLLPILQLNSSEVLEIQFDEMSHDAHSYGYKIIHCNADWTISSLNSSEYLNGYTTGNITNNVLSVNTTFLYTHYSVDLPNEDIKFKISGNYVVIIYEDNNIDTPVAQACFSIVDPKVGIQATVRGNTDIELNRRYQQVDFDVKLDGYSIRDPNAELKIVVRQNNRWDNAVQNITPTFISGSKLSYINNKSLIFEGGYEYHRFDISSVYAASEGIAKIIYKQPHYEVFLQEDKINAQNSYSHNFDVNGKFVVNFQESVENSNTEGDYMFVHVSLPTQQPFFDGQLYLGGEFNYNLMNDVNRLMYDGISGKYSKTLLLKQGGYNYQYWFIPKGIPKATNERVDGNYWQTINEYTIYVYNRPWGDRYDKLIGVLSIESNK